MQSKVSKKQIIGAVVAASLSVALGFVMVLIIALATLDAMAATPAIVKVIGTPSSKRLDCDLLRRFTHEVISWRDKGGTIEQAHAEAVKWRLENGATVQSACQIINSVNAVWVLEGSADAASKTVYESCMRERT